ncbi:AzlD domain-containing protein [Fuscibacter oryzae]|uniref:AzlD domain-containing protein n=1 Tax=Fuscibacter oryzae TaxID=2803939 RepID=A0A8J7SU55_9RHOB|nr:AzlD domain-containing protein [Fuscibacter oryzae]MBL4929946.1 AzlD domain-containing protein [Fuscibacter oryzae]
MRAEILTLALMVGAFTWAFRVLPTRADLSAMPEGGLLSRFLAATGPAAIATLFTASVLPMVQGGMPLPLAGGTVAVLAVFAATRSVVAATLAGSIAYGALFALT